MAIGLVLALVLRSLVAPLYLILSVVLSYLASLGISVLVFMKIGGQEGIVFLLPFLMFIFLLALGEDYNILVMFRVIGVGLAVGILARHVRRAEGAGPRHRRAAGPLELVAVTDEPAGRHSAFARSTGGLGCCLGHRGRPPPKPGGRHDRRQGEVVHRQGDRSGRAAVAH